MRIAIVNDVLMSVEALRRVLLNAPHEIAWVARNGSEAVEFCARDTPDIILMDLIMPVMSGVEATRRIMASNPCAILIVTATVEGNAGYVFDALGAGAVDAIATPILGHDGKSDGAAMLIAKIDRLNRLILDDRGSRSSVTSNGSIARRGEPVENIVVIGASAGGPMALATILRALPSDFPVPLVIVQHIDKQFTHSMAEWLNEQSSLRVRIITRGERPAVGCVLLAGTNDHLVLSETGLLEYTPLPQGGFYRPSIDIFFSSVAKHWKCRGAGLLLTGMGKDGAKGLKTLREAGFLTVAQDRASSAVYGMPKAAAEIAAADVIMPVNKIAACLVDVFVHNRTAKGSYELALDEKNHGTRNN